MSTSYCARQHASRFGSHIYQRQHLLQSGLRPWSEAAVIARVRLQCLTHLLSAGAWPASSCMRVALEFFQENAPSLRSVTWVTRVANGHVHFKRSIRRFRTLNECVAMLNVAGSGRLQLSAFGYHPVLQIAPERNRQAPCHRDDRDAPRAAVRPRALRALVEPLRQCTVGLVA